MPLSTHAGRPGQHPHLVYRVYAHGHGCSLGMGLCRRGHRLHGHALPPGFSLLGQRAHSGSLLVPPRADGHSRAGALAALMCAGQPLCAALRRSLQAVCRELLLRRSTGCRAAAHRPQRLRQPRQCWLLQDGSPDQSHDGHQRAHRGMHASLERQLRARSRGQADLGVCRSWPTSTSRSKRSASALARGCSACAPRGAPCTVAALCRSRSASTPGMAAPGGAAGGAADPLGQAWAEAPTTGRPRPRAALTGAPAALATTGSGLPAILAPAKTGPDLTAATAGTEAQTTPTGSHMQRQALAGTICRTSSSAAACRPGCRTGCRACGPAHAPQSRGQPTATAVTQRWAPLRTPCSTHREPGTGAWAASVWGDMQ